jgi:drug/metabolite transporter (DMT)-like permease
MFAALALASAVCYGAADFLGGMTARRASTIAVVVLSQSTGLMLLVVTLPLLPAAAPSHGDYVWGAVAGVTGSAGVALLYRALAIGVMAVVAPTTAVCAVALPVLVAVVLGERPGMVRVGGILLAVVAIVLVSQSNSAQPIRSEGGSASRLTAFPLAMLSGVAIGLFYLALARTTGDAGLWPLVAARVVSVSLFAGMAFVGSRSLRMPARVGGVVAAGGILDMLANVLYLIASRSGPLSVVVTLASLYPASTVLLARVVLHERLSSRQWVGVACALLAVIMIVG